MRARTTYIGTATLLLEIGDSRLLTDPALDPAPTEHSMEPAPGLKIGSRKLIGPALTEEELGPLDTILLSHDEHFDNLDGAGRRVLETATRTVTTPAGARRLGSKAIGLAPWTSLELPGQPGIRVTAVPARHGPEGTEAIIGETTGFVLEWDGQLDGALYISGDTVWFDELEEIGKRFDIGTAVLHLGAGGFDVAGDLRFSLDAAGGLRLADAISAQTVVPVHYDGWSHFTQPVADARAALDDALGDRVLWLEPGVPTDL